ncbi:MAG: DUF262 domain-containing protein [Cytophagales bacterium]|nr:DUF262 domain-containing protein [Cytophagales bacterium]
MSIDHKEVKTDSDKRTVGQVLRDKVGYHVDFYQREYTWGKEEDGPLLQLLEDIYEKFKKEHKKYGYDSENDEMELDEYAWYFLNTIVIHSSGTDPRQYVADGQQRMTTLMLIMMVFKRIKEELDLKRIEPERYYARGDDKDPSFVISHEIFHEGTKDLLSALIAGKKREAEEKSKEGDTKTRIYENFYAIEKWLRDKFKLGERKVGYDKEKADKLLAFFLYVIKRVALIEMRISTEDVSPVFLGINDRGVRLEPYEILKAQVFGSFNRRKMPEAQFRDCVLEWDEIISELKKIGGKKEGEETVVDFFVRYLQARHLGKQEAEAEILKKRYHKVIERKYRESLNDDEKFWGTTFFEQFKCYSKVFMRILEYEKEDKYHGYFCKVVFAPRVLRVPVLAAVELDDKDDIVKEKIESVSKELDRLYTLIRLQNPKFENRSWNEVMFDVVKGIRGSTPSDYREHFNKVLDKHISRISGKKEKDGIPILFNWRYCQERKNEGRADDVFIKYVLGRVENHLASKLGEKQIEYSRFRLQKKKGPSFKGTVQLEHILGNHEQNEYYYYREAVPDYFKRSREKLGALTLLTQPLNSSLKDGLYSEKVENYFTQGIIISKILSERFWKNPPTAKRGMYDIKEKYGLDYVKPTEEEEKEVTREIRDPDTGKTISKEEIVKVKGIFPEDGIEARQKALFRICAEIWEVPEENPLFPPRT